MRKKILIIGLSIICMFSVVYADDADIEEYSGSNVLEEIETIQTASELEKEPNINSRSAVVIDRNTGDILFGKKENEQRPMASTTKIMTAIVVLEKANLTDIVEISKKSASTGGSRLGLKTGDKITVQDLLYGLMLCSGNDAAVALAEHVGGSVEEFAVLMNEKARELKLENTSFVTPHGLDAEKHYTTAYELAKITKYALENTKFCNIVQTKYYTVSINGSSKNLHNTNELLGNLNGVYGVKTGFTNGANRCLVTSVKRGNLDIICVVLGADTKKFRTQDSVKLIEYIYSNYELVNIEEIINSSEEWNRVKNTGINVEKGKKECGELSLEEISINNKSILKQKIKDIKVEIEMLGSVKAPLKQNEIVGSVKVKIEDNLITYVNIITKEEVERKDIIDYFKEFMIEYQLKEIHSIF